MFDLFVIWDLSNGLVGETYDKSFMFGPSRPKTRSAFN